MTYDSMNVNERCIEALAGFCYQVPFGNFETS